MTPEQMRQRIAELEEALRPFAPTPEVLQAIQYIHDSGELYLGENGWQIGPITAGDLRRAASLLSASTPASEPEGDVVEGADKRLNPCPFCGDLASVQAHGMGRGWGAGPGYRVECQGRCHGMTCYWHTEAEAIDHWNARAALTAMRPVSVDREKLTEIRERHESADTSGQEPKTDEGREMLARVESMPFASLCGATMTDLEVAYEIAVTNRNDLKLVAAQTTAKDRIRWLSAQLRNAHADRAWLLSAIEGVKP